MGSQFSQLQWGIGGWVGSAGSQTVPSFSVGAFYDARVLIDTVNYCDRSISVGRCCHPRNIVKAVQYIRSRRPRASCPYTAPTAALSLLRKNAGLSDEDDGRGLGLALGPVSGPGGGEEASIDRR